MALFLIRRISNSEYSDLIEPEQAKPPATPTERRHATAASGLAAGASDFNQADADAIIAEVRAAFDREGLAGLDAVALAAWSLWAHAKGNRAFQRENG